MSEEKPIKRNDNIAPLSREHHYGLLFCWKIKQGMKKEATPERIQKYIKYFWDEHLKEHFAKEEELLFSKIDDKLCFDAIEQHVKIKKIIDDICNQNNLNTEAYIRLTTLLEQHIRFEERTLFPFLELSIPPEQLKLIGTSLNRMHETPLIDNYPDEFWVN